MNLNVLALVALFTGGLLVFSTQALSVARRRPQIALLRVLGYTRTQVTGLLLAEGLLLGLAGAALGLAGGFVLAHVAMQFVGADLGAGYFRGVAPALQASPGAALTFGCPGRGGRSRRELRSGAGSRTRRTGHRPEKRRRSARLRRPAPGLAGRAAARGRRSGDPPAADRTAFPCSATSRSPPCSWA